jgi:hypothetical protein
MMMMIVLMIFDFSRRALLINDDNYVENYAIRILEKNKEKTVFRCRYKHFEYRIMFFKLINISTLF